MIFFSYIFSFTDFFTLKIDRKFHLVFKRKHKFYKAMAGKALIEKICKNAKFFIETKDNLNFENEYVIVTNFSKTFQLNKNYIIVNTYEENQLDDMTNQCKKFEETGNFLNSCHRIFINIYNFFLSF